ncbi:MAG: Integral membrane protein [uncultured Clostridium sp.]
MNKVINLIKRLILFFIGMSIIQFGVALFLKTSIGSDPFTVFTEGLATVLDKTALKDFSIVQMIAGSAEVTPGVANMIILIVLFIGILIVDMKRIKIGTLICVVGVGPIIDLGVKAVSYFPIDSANIFIKMLLVLLGCFIIAVGFSIISASDIGVAPNDIVPFIIKDKLNCQYRWVRIGFDATFLIIGFIFGGTIGVGTIIAMLATGPFIQLLLPYGKKVVDFIVNSKEESESTIIA